MEEYLGETIINIKDTEFKDYTPSDWVLYFIERYGQIDGAHHKQWVLDQVARIIHGTPVIIKLAKWDSGNSEYRVVLGEPSQKYLDWVEEMKCWNETDEEYEYSYEEGIAP